MVLLFLAFACLFLADGLFNWAMFRPKKKYGYQSYDERYRPYGPIERLARIALGAVFVGIMLLISAAFFQRGGLRALVHPQDYTGADWRPPPPAVVRAPVTPTPPPLAPPPPPEPVGAGPVAEPTVEAPVEPEPPPQAPEPRRNDELHFWIYEDEQGETHMVDDLAKVPEALRGKAREMR